MKGFIIASPSSGTGKTIITLGILHALKCQGILVNSAKIGPDYIDAEFHSAISGKSSVNLDVWGMRPLLITRILYNILDEKSTLIIESMMGLFDGAINNQGSTAILSCNFGFPIIFVVDCTKISHSIAAIIYGFNNYWKNLKISGIILNKVNSYKHEIILRKSLYNLYIPIVGVVYRNKDLFFSERYLGLVQACENPFISSFKEKINRIIIPKLDTKKILEISSVNKKIKFLSKVSYLPPLGNHIAIAYDNAFRFLYSHILDGWINNGAKVSYFSPINNEGPLEDADAIYLPGGYPELYAKKLASASNFKKKMKHAAEKKCIIYGECGGYMVLGKILEDIYGISYEMLNLLPLVTSLKNSHLHLGYRKTRPIEGTSFPWNFSMRGHEFHYAKTIWKGCSKPLFKLRNALDDDLGICGLDQDNIFGSFIHIIDSEN